MADVVAEIPQIAMPTPLMGWASWNSCSSQITAAIIKEQAEAIVSSGLAEAGYCHIGIDAGWWDGGHRDAGGNPIADDEVKWPGGMAAIADYLHRLGLKAGMYTDAGCSGCGSPDWNDTGSPLYDNSSSGSYGRYEQDFLQFARWGYDYVKVDWCGGSEQQLNPKTQYTQIAEAAYRAGEATGKRLILSLCNWGVERPWEWAAGLGRQWRTTGDIIEPRGTPTFESLLSTYDGNYHPLGQHTGYFNDADMLTVGMAGATRELDRVHLGLWAIAGSPLIAGHIPSQQSPEVLADLTNPRMISVDQDSRGLQGLLVAEPAPGLQVWSRTLAGHGNRAVLLLNRTETAQPIEATFTALGLADGKGTLTDVWTGATHRVNGSVRANVPARDAVFVTLSSGNEVGCVTCPAADGDLTGTATIASGGSRVSGIGPDGSVTFRGMAGAAGYAVVDIAYANGDGTERRATLTVNDGIPTTLAFPPTGGADRFGTVSAIVELAEGTANRLRLTGPIPGPGVAPHAPDFAWITVQQATLHGGDIGA